MNQMYRARAAREAPAAMTARGGLSMAASPGATRPRRGVMSAQRGAMIQLMIVASTMSESAMGEVRSVGSIKRGVGVGVGVGAARRRTGWRKRCASEGARGWLVAASRI